MCESTGNHGQRGSALLAALVIALALVALGATFLTVSLTDRSIASNEAGAGRAFNLAEAGIEHAIAELPDQNVDALLAGGGALFANQAMAGGAYSVTVTNNISPDFPVGLVPADAGGASDDTDDYLVLSSTGTFDSASRGIRVIAKLGSSGGPFKWAAFGINKLKASNSVIHGAAGTNGDMTFSGSGPRVVGDAQAVGSISDPTEYVTGTATQGAAPEVFPPVSCPAGPYGPEPTGPGYSFDAGSGKISIGGPVTFNSGTYFFSEVSKSGGDNIVVPLGANVQIYIEKKLSMSGGGFTNLNGSAKTLQIWGCGGTTDGWSVTGPQDVWFTIYAPTNKVKFTGEGNKYGSFIGFEWENSGPGSAYYDASLNGGGATELGSSGSNIRIDGVAEPIVR
jgi:Tfp pilus assembly protein PilX